MYIYIYIHVYTIDYIYMSIYIYIIYYIYMYIYICVPASLCCAEIIADFFPQSFWTGTARTRSWTAAKRREAEATLQTVTFWNTQTHSVLVCGPVADMGVSENRVGYTKKVWPIREHVFFYQWIWACPVSRLLAVSLLPRLFEQDRMKREEA